MRRRLRRLAIEMFCSEECCVGGAEGALGLVGQISAGQILCQVDE